MKDTEFIYIPREHDFIPLSNEALVQLKEKIYKKYIDSICNTSKQIIPELIDFIFNSKWRHFIENRPDELVEGNEWYIESYIYSDCQSMINYVKEKNVEEQSNFLNIWKSKGAK